MKLTGMFKLDYHSSTRSVVRLAEVYNTSPTQSIGTEVFMDRRHFETLGLTADDTIQITIKRAKVVEEKS